MVYKTPDATIAALCRTIPPSPLDRTRLDKTVKDALKGTPSSSSAELRKSKWELALKNEVFKLAMKEGDALKNSNTTYYNELNYHFDLMLSFTENDACDATFPFTVLQDLLETQTIASCSHIFSWIEARAGPLTIGMVPQKGKALVILRTLNDLLRRLSKMGSNTIFCGRILTFLSAVFPLGERSGVNLRGEYGQAWENVEMKKDETMDKNEETRKAEISTEGRVTGEKKDEKAGDKGSDEDAMLVDLESKDLERSEKADFYNTFWSIQLPFSRPHVFSGQKTLEDFRSAVDKILPVFKEATERERKLTGSRGSQNAPSVALKRKRSLDETESGQNDYFFAKFLTSPDLLDLEVADTHFRRQILFQLLILLFHLQTFTPSAKTGWCSPRNRSLQMDFTLEDADADWVTDTITRVRDELRQTAPGGRVLEETVTAILERDRNWVRWKNDLCSPFDRTPQQPSLEDETREARKRMRADPEPWPHTLGSQPLSEIWNFGFTELRDLENPFSPGDVKDYVKKTKQSDGLIQQRKNQLERVAAQRAKAKAEAAAAASSTDAITIVDKTEAIAPAPSTDTAEGAKGSPAPPVVPKPPPPQPPDPVIAKHEETKQRYAWLALRIARERHYAQLARCETGDILLLQQAIEDDAREERERVEKARTVREIKGAEDSPMPDADTGEGDNGNSHGDNGDAPPRDEDMEMKDTETPISSQPPDVEMVAAEQGKPEEVVSRK